MAKQYFTTPAAMPVEKQVKVVTGRNISVPEGYAVFVPVDKKKNNFILARSYRNVNGEIVNNPETKPSTRKSATGTYTVDVPKSFSWEGRETIRIPLTEEKMIKYLRNHPSCYGSDLYKQSLKFTKEKEQAGEFLPVVHATFMEIKPDEQALTYLTLNTGPEDATAFIIERIGRFKNGEVVFVDDESEKLMNHVLMSCGVDYTLLGSSIQRYSRLKQLVPNQYAKIVAILSNEDEDVMAVDSKFNLLVNNKTILKRGMFYQYGETNIGNERTVKAILAGNSKKENAEQIRLALENELE